MKKISPEDKAGLYITAIVHLSVLIILLIGSLGYSLRKESSFVLDFTKLEELERLQKEVAFKEQISRRLDRMIAQSGRAPIRNVAVDRAALKDDRGTDAKKLYEDAKRVSRDIENSLARRDVSPDEAAVADGENEQKEKKREYSGPSVASYELDGRKAVRLPIPAYRCLGAGEVRVIISVNRKGAVTAASVDKGVSSTDGCLRDFAVRAARLSRFNASDSAPENQEGNIVYKFIAQ